MADVFGNDGDDVLITGTTGADLIYGASDTDQTDTGADTIDGDRGDDVIFGGAGNDVLDGGRGSDTLFGGDGDDTLIVDDSDDIVDGGAGYDILDFSTSIEIGAGFQFTGIEELSAVNSRITMGAGLSVLDLSSIQVNNISFKDGTGAVLASIRGRNDNTNGDSIIGTQDDDFISALNGDDSIDGGLGSDTLEGGRGNDFLTGGDVDGTQNDVLDGGQNDDTIDLGVLNIGDSVDGGAGTDALALELAAATGINRLKITDTTLELNLDTANPIGVEGIESYDVTGTNGNDWLFISNGDANTDVITFDGAGGTSDFVFFEFTSANFGVTAVINNDGTSSANVVQSGGAFNQTYAFTNVEGFITSLGADSLTGSDNRDVLNGGAGDDTIEGGAGNDVLAGGTGSDRFIFGTGSGRDAINDFEFGAGGDVLDVSAYGFTSLAQVQAAISGSQLNLGISDSIFFKNGVTAADLTVDNIVTGSGGVTQTINGTTGNDTFRLSSGDYLIDGDTGTDTLRLLGTTDQVVAMSAGTGGSGTAIFTGGAVATFSNIENIITGDGNDTITADDQNNVLRGGAGDDEITGAGGNDVMIGDAGSDTFVFATGSGSDTINDFEDGVDQLDVSAFGLAGIADFAAISGSAAGTLISITAGESVFLRGVSDADISDADFLF